MRDDLALSGELAARFEEWLAPYVDQQAADDEYDFDYEAHAAQGRELARLLKRVAGDVIYVEYDPLVEVMRDGAEKDWREELPGGCSSAKGRDGESTEK